MDTLSVQLPWMQEEWKSIEGILLMNVFAVDPDNLPATVDRIIVECNAVFGRTKTSGAYSALFDYYYRTEDNATDKGGLINRQIDPIVMPK